MGMLSKGLLLYFCIAIAVSFWQPDLLYGSGGSATNGVNILSPFGVTYNQSTGQPQIPYDQQSLSNKSETAQMLSQGSEGTGQSFWLLIDPLHNVMSFISILFNFLFSPIIIFGHLLSMGAPIIAVMVFALPLVFLVFLGVIYFIGGRVE